MLDAWIIDKQRQDRQREQDRRSWERVIHAPTPSEYGSPERTNEPERGSSTVNFEL